MCRTLSRRRRRRRRRTRRSRRRRRRRRNRYGIGIYPDKSLTVDGEVIGLGSFQTHHHFPDLLLDDLWSDTDRRASELALVRGERCICVRLSPHPHRAMTADSPDVPAITPPAWVPCGTKHKQDRPGGSWGVKKHHTTQRTPTAVFCARLGVVFVGLYFFRAGGQSTNETPLVWIAVLYYIKQTNDRQAARSACKTKHKTPQLVCIPSSVFGARRRAKKVPSVSPAAGRAGRRGARPPPKYLGPGSLPLYTDHLDLKTLCPGSRLMVLYVEYARVGPAGVGSQGIGKMSFGGGKSSPCWVSGPPKII